MKISKFTIFGDSGYDYDYDDDYYYYYYDYDDEFRKSCLAVGFSPWRLVDGTAGAAAAQEQQEQQQQHQRTTAPAAAAAAAAASVLHCYGVSLSGTHVFAAASRQPVLYSTIYSLRFSRMYSLGFSRIL